MTNKTYRRLKGRCIGGLVAGALLGLLALPYVSSKGRALSDERTLAHSMDANDMRMLSTNLW